MVKLVQEDACLIAIRRLLTILLENVCLFVLATLNIIMEIL
jgi:hypothetical protein